jgi:hypothetical protein
MSSSVLGKPTRKRLQSILIEKDERQALRVGIAKLHASHPFKIDAQLAY